jgi:hypothetical protein
MPPAEVTGNSGLGDRRGRSSGMIAGRCVQKSGLVVAGPLGDIGLHDREEVNDRSLTFTQPATR